MTTITTNTVDMSATFAAFKQESAISFIRPWIKDTPELAGYTHHKLEYRTSDKKAVEKPSQMVTVPAIQLPEEYSLLPVLHKQAVLDYFNRCQKDLIKVQVAEGAKLIHWQAISLDSVIEFLTAERETNYLTKESVLAWVSANMVEQFRARGAQIAEAKGYNDLQSAQQIAKTVVQYQELFGKLAAKVPPLAQAQATSLQNQLLLLSADKHDRMYKVLSDKLHKILNPAEASDDL